MGKSSTGPDMLDVLQYCLEIQKAQDAGITLLVEPAGSELAPTWFVHALAVPRWTLLSNTQPAVSAFIRWPHRDHKTFDGALFSLMALIDAEFGKRTFQEILGIA
jgi:hypothetical protein